MARTHTTYECTYDNVGHKDFLGELLVYFGHDLAFALAHEPHAFRHVTVVVIIVVRLVDACQRFRAVRCDGVVVERCRVRE
jgi:hypothetical protein